MKKRAVTISHGDGRGVKIPPGHGQMSRGIESAIAREPGQLAHESEHPPASSRRVTSVTKRTHYPDGGPGLNGTRGQVSPVLGLEGKQPIIDGPVPIYGRQMPHPDLVSKAQEAASADREIGDAPHPAGTLGRA